MTSQAQAGFADKEELVTQLADDFLDRHRQGESPSIAEYIYQYPQLAEEIHEVFPVVAFVEGVAADSQEDEGPHPPAHAAGDQLGDFCLRRLLGQGGMGAVYEAEQISRNKLVALKVLSAKRLRSETYRQRFDREARTAANLHHPNIVPVFEVGQDRGEMYYAMKYIQGERLDHAFSRSGAPDARSLEPGEPTDCGKGQPSVAWRDIARIGKQLANALHYAHENGVLHRDIKPANLMLDEQGNPWITDFGLAKLDDDRQPLTIHGELVGTIRYMAPETFEGQHTTRSDIYSLGISLYELLTMKPAFDDVERMALVRSIVAGSVRPLVPDELGIPQDLVSVIHTAIQRSPKERYQTANEFAADLHDVLHDQPPLCRRSLWARLGRWFRKRARTSEPKSENGYSGRC